ncbi:unnamed protein product [Orchesella dallaii]|uniref:Uncharacterized protein n=1 Tax=Orchesella dallaii TaxID=48710 RepID=A0ABP1RY21_9HEXA
MKQMKSVRLYVATRPHLKEELESIIDVLGYNILPFGESEQIQFLTKYWKEQQAAPNQLLVQFAKCCLSVLKQNMNDFERDITGIPLQCKLLAEVYEHQAINYSRPESKVSESDLGVVINITSIFEMYRKFMQMRFNRINETMKQSSCVTFRVIEELSRKKRMTVLSRVHIYASMKLLFPENEEQFRSMLPVRIKVEPRKLCALGVLERLDNDDGAPRFVHRTFAEYFVGLFVALSLTKENPKRELLQFCFQTVLKIAESDQHILKLSSVTKSKCVKAYHFRYPVICYFINSHLKHIVQTASKKQRYQHWFHSAVTFNNIFAACAVHDFPELFKICGKYTQWMPTTNTPSTLCDLLYLSSSHSGKELVQIIDAHRQDVSFIESETPKFVITPLHVAVQRGEYAIVEVLLHSERFSCSKDVQYVFHCLVHNSIYENESTICQKKQVIQLLNATNKQWINEPFPDGVTPILCSTIHVELIKQLIKFGANVNQTCRAGPVLHKALQSISDPKCYHDLLMLLKTNEYNQFNATDYKGRTALHLGVEKFELLDDTMQQLQVLGTNFQAIDEGGDSVLFYAIRGGRSVILLQWLVLLGAELEHQNLKNDNVFHICATYGNINAMTYILESQTLHKTAVISKNMKGFTPFMQGLAKGRGMNVHSIQLMENNGLVLTEKLASKGLMCLLLNKQMLASQLSNIEFVQVADYLMAKGGLFTCQDGKNTWNLETTKRNMQRIVQVTQCNAALLMEIGKRANTCYEDMEIYLGHSAALYEDLQSSPERNNLFVILCASLIACNQMEPFLLLRQCLQSHFYPSAKFTTPPAGIIEFVQSNHNNVLQLYSYDIELTIGRLKDTVDSDLKVFEDDNIPDQTETQNLLVLKCKPTTSINKLKERLCNLPFKVVLVCTNICMAADCTCIIDNVSWDDLSINYQRELSFKMWHTIHGKSTNSMDISRNSSVLRNEFLVALIQNFDDDTHGLPISTTIFHYFLSDKLVFQGINVNELRKYARFGQHIGSNNAYKRTLDYIIVENKQEFIEISKKISTPAMHLIQYQNERFHLIQSTGSQETITKFIDRNHCDIKFRCQIDRLPIVFQAAEKESFELFEVASLFSHVCKQSNNWKLWEKFKDVTTSLLPVGKQITAIVSELFQTLICCERDWKKLEYVALSTLFRNLLINSEICGLQKYVDIGLLQETSGVLYFVHDTLAWYLISKLILSESTVCFADLNYLRTTLLHNCFEANKVTEFGGISFCDEITSFTFKNRRLFDFVDNLFSHQLNVKKHKSRIRLILSECSDSSEKWIYACVQANHINILNIILACEIHSVLFESEQLVVLAVMFGSVEIIKTISEKFITQTGKDIHDIRVKLEANSSTNALNISVLHVAALRGDHKVMSYLLKIGELNTLQAEIQNSLLNFCVFSTFGIPIHHINERKKILEHLKQISSSQVNGKDWFGRTSLLVSNVHMDLLLQLQLINLSVNLHISNQISQNILYVCPQYLRPEEYDSLIHRLKESGNTKIFHSRDMNLCTPIQCAVENLELQDSTLGVFLSAKVDINCVDRVGDTVLIKAVRYHRSARLYEALIRAGAGIQTHNSKNNMVLHVAAEEGNLTAIRYFIFRGMDVNARCKANTTPLHCVLASAPKNAHIIIEVLLENGADVNAGTNQKDTPLSIAIKQNQNGKIDDRTVNYLRGFGAHELP